MDRIRRRDLFPLPLLAFTVTSARAADCEALVSAIRRVQKHIVRVVESVRSGRCGMRPPDFRKACLFATVTLSA